MARTKLSKADYVTLGYGQVEPNHLSAQRTGQIYAQLPAEASIDLLENGQFVKYDYSTGTVNFSGKGEWMLVYNEVKVYEDYETDADFAMIKKNYNARVYSPIDGESVTTYKPVNYDNDIVDAKYAADGTTSPMGMYAYAAPKLMPEGTKMVPRVYKTNVGDIYTTNCIMGDPAMGATLAPNGEGYLAAAEDGDMLWQVVKKYNLADGQKAVKLMRIA